MTRWKNTTQPRHKAPYCRMDARPAGHRTWWIRCYTCDTTTLQDTIARDEHCRPTRYYRQQKP